MAEERYPWLDSATAERLLSCERVEAVDEPARTGLERLATALGSLSDIARANESEASSGDIPDGMPRGEDAPHRPAGAGLPGEAAALAAFRAARAGAAPGRAGAGLPDTIRIAAGTRVVRTVGHHRRPHRTGRGIAVTAAACTLGALTVVVGATALVMAPVSPDGVGSPLVPVLPATGGTSTLPLVPDAAGALRTASPLLPDGIARQLIPVPPVSPRIPFVAPRGPSAGANPWQTTHRAPVHRASPDPSPSPTQGPWGPHDQGEPRGPRSAGSSPSGPSGPGGGAWGPHATGSPGGPVDDHPGGTPPRAETCRAYLDGVLPLLRRSALERVLGGPGAAERFCTRLLGGADAGDGHSAPHVPGKPVEPSSPPPGAGPVATPSPSAPAASASGPATGRSAS